MPVMIDRVKKADELMKQAEGFGLHIRLDGGLGGLLFTKQLATADPEVCAIMLGELDKYREEIRKLLEQRGLEAVAKDLVGKRFLSPEGRGTVTGVGAGSGNVFASVFNEELQRELQIKVSLRTLLFLEFEDENAAKSNGEPAPGKPSRRNLFDLLRSLGKDN
jgi:hypothetical protein